MIKISCVKRERQSPKNILRLKILENPGLSKSLTECLYSSVRMLTLPASFANKHNVLWAGNLTTCFHCYWLMSVQLMSLLIHAFIQFIYGLISGLLSVSFLQNSIKAEKPDPRPGASRMSSRPRGDKMFSQSGHCGTFMPGEKFRGLEVMTADSNSYGVGDKAKQQRRHIKEKKQECHQELRRMNYAALLIEHCWF